MPCHARHVNNTCCLTNKPWFLRQPGDLFRDIQSCWRVAAIWFNTEMLLRTCRSDRGTYRYRRCAGRCSENGKQGCKGRVVHYPDGICPAEIPLRKRLGVSSARICNRAVSCFGELTKSRGRNEY